jgi:hypothetical protein
LAEFQNRGISEFHDHGSASKVGGGGDILKFCNSEISECYDPPMTRLLSFCVAAGLGVATMAAQGQAPAPAQAPAAPPQYSADLKVGDVAPAFSLQGSDGKTHALSAYKGKTVVLAWFPKAFTGG